MKRFGKIDRNQPEIVKALRQVGASVQSLASVGSGCPDLLVGFRGCNYLVEVKDGAAPPSARLLTPDQIKWHAEWPAKVYVVYGVPDALAIIGVESVTLYWNPAEG